MGQTLEPESRSKPLTHSPVVESKASRNEEERKLYNTSVYTREQHVFTSPRTKPMPRGLQIPAYDTVTLERGFPYIKDVFICFGIDKNDWENFQDALLAALSIENDTTKNESPGRKVVVDAGNALNRAAGRSIMDNAGKGKDLLAGRAVADNVDKLLDCVADWDVRFFRSRGLVMRMDMPGEEKYGLDFMDIYYRGLIINTSGVGQREGIIQEFMKSKPIKKRQIHIDRARERGYCSTRIVLDPVEVLQNKQLSDVRGWTAWNQQCKEAKRHRTRPPLRPNKQQTDTESWFKWTMIERNSGYHSFTGDQRLRLRFATDHWPPSKYFYYDRFRGREEHPNPTEGTNQSLKRPEGYKWVPETDSMDQRCGGPLHKPLILPADDLQYMVVDDKSGVSIANYMTRGGSTGNGDGTPAARHWIADLRGQEELSTCPWPDFPWPQGRGTERLDLVDGCESCKDHHETL